MKKRISKLLSVLLAGLSVFGMFTGCVNTGDSSSGAENTPPPAAPDYTASTEQFDLYAYTGPRDNIYTLDGEVIVEGNEDVSFQTVEKYKEYADCGFNILLLQADDMYRGEAYETSHIKKLLDTAQEAGLKVIMFDNRLHNLSMQTNEIVGEGKQYATQEDLNAYVAECMKDYAKHPAFYGLQFKDEPTYMMLSAMGATYKAVKANYPDCFVQCNLFPLNPKNYAKYQMGATEKTVNTAYKWYLEEFLAQSGANYIMFDSYPICTDGGNSYIGTSHLKTLQIAAEICKEKKVELYAVAQSCSYSNAGIQKTRACTEADMYWQTNLFMGMGVKQVSYFTYQRKRTNTTTGEYFDDGTSFLTTSGETTELYDWMKNIHSEMQALAPVILNYDYQGLATYVGAPAPCSMAFLGNVTDSEFVKVSEVTTSEESVLFISELYDQDKDLYGYMILNLADPSVKANLTAEIKFKDCTWSSVYNKGVHSQKKLDNGVYKVSLAAGQAVFVIPY